MTTFWLEPGPGPLPELSPALCLHGLLNHAALTCSQKGELHTEGVPAEP